MRSFSTALFACSLFVALGTAACGRQIGDACITVQDCFREDDNRVCDTSQPDGFCTQDTCDQSSCPDSSICVRAFPRAFLTRTCDPNKIGACPADETCLPSGQCAPRASERRYCSPGCSTDKDCRKGYHCRLDQTEGTFALLPTSTMQTSTKPTRYCAPSEAAAVQVTSSKRPAP